MKRILVRRGFGQRPRYVFASCQLHARLFVRRMEVKGNV